MTAAPLPPDEDRRLRALAQYEILDTTAEQSFDRLVGLTAALIDAPIVLISLVDEGRQWFKAKRGLDVAETPRDISFCAHAILKPAEIMVVPDASRDPRFKHNPLVTGAPSIRFYAGAPLVTPEGRTLGTLCVIDDRPRDLTPAQRNSLNDLAALVIDQLELRRIGRAAIAEGEERRRLEAVKEEFVSLISHELRTPLTAILGALDLVDSGRTGAIPERAARMVEIARAGGQRLLGMVDDLLDLSKLESGRFSIQRGPLDLGRVVDDAIRDMAAFAEKGAVVLERSGHVGAAPAMGDSNRLGQVVTNLISNAVKFSPPGSKVTLSLDPADTGWAISVTDRGPGIPVQFRARLFEKFAQDDTTPSRLHRGSGLGLFIAQSIAREHGGRITVKTREGEGSTFRLDLPQPPHEG